MGNCVDNGGTEVYYVIPCGRCRIPAARGRSYILAVAIALEFSMKSLADMQKKMQTGVTNGASSYVSGVQAVKSSPTAAAAAAVDKYSSGTQRAVSDGTFVAGCNSVSLAQWQAAAAGKGKTNYAAAAPAAAANWGSYMQQALPVIQQNQQQIASMPSATDSDNDQRMLENVKLQRALKGRFKGKM